MAVKRFILLVMFFLLAFSAYPLTLDELLGSYDWDVNNKNIVNSVTYTNIDSDLDGKFDKIQFSVSVTDSDTLRYVGFLGDSVAEGSKLVSGTNVISLNFSSSDFDDGFYNFSFRIFDSSGNTIIDQYNNMSYHFDASLHEPPKVVPSFSGFAYIDTDSDSLYELLVCNLALDVNVSGDYTITAYLKQNDSFVISQSNVSLLEGIHLVNASFSSKDIRLARFDGTLVLDSIKIAGSSSRRIFPVNHSFVIDYADFDPETSIITGSFIDSGVDSDSDSLYDQLQLSFAAFFNSSGTFSIMGSVDDLYGSHVMDFNQTQSFSAGNRVVTLYLDGSGFWGSKVNGPYRISYLKIVDAGDSSKVYDNFISPYILSGASYYTDFDTLPLPDLTVRFTAVKDLGNNHSAVDVKVSNDGESFVLAAYVELYNNFTDMVGSSSAYLLHPGSSKIIRFPRVYTGNTDALSAFVDIFDYIEESDESNNIDTANTFMSGSIGYNSTSGSAPLSVQFSSSAAGGNLPYSFSWDFGDGIYSSLQDPVKSFAAGNYSVALTITDRVGLTYRDSVNISVSSSGVDTVPPNSVSSLSAQDRGVDWIYWAWTNPSDPDFSHSMLYLGGSNIANTSSSYYNSTGLSQNTSYSFSIRTVDFSGNINSSVVMLIAQTLSSGQNQSGNQTNQTSGGYIDGLRLDRYSVFGYVGQPISFDAGWYYPSAGISSVSWDFGDSSSSSSVSTAHTYSSKGNYTVQLTVNSVIKENITAYVSDRLDYGYVSPVNYFSSVSQPYTLIGSSFGNSALNGFVTSYDKLRIYAIAKIDGDDDISIMQVRVSGSPSKSCWSIGNGYFKCLVSYQTAGVLAEANNTYTLSLRDDSGNTVASVAGFHVAELQGPDTEIDIPERFKVSGSFDFSYSVSDLAYPGMSGSGVGKIEIYEDGIYQETVVVDSGSYSGFYTYTPPAVAAGEDSSHEVCFTAYDRARLGSDACEAVVLDRKVPVLNSVSIIGDISSVSRLGKNISIKANLSDLSPVNVSANFLKVNKDSPAGYTDKDADSCVKDENYWICSWDDVVVKLDEGGDYNITFYYSDILGNSGYSIVTERIGVLNNAPVLSVSDISVDEGDIIILVPSASDSDGDAVSYSYSGWMDSDTYQTTYSDSGSHLVTVTASDPFGASDSKNITITVKDVGLPDLIITELSYKPASPVKNSPIMLRYVIKNIGESKAYDVAWSMESAGAIISKQQSLFDLDVGEEMVVYGLIQYQSAGTFNPVISVDPSDTILELDESNNQKSVQIIVS